jgi:hypothetical protein
MSRVNPVDDLLLPPSGSLEDLEVYRSILDHYAARLLLKEVIKSDSLETWLKGRRSVERFCDSRSVDDFLSRLTGLGVLKHSAEGFPVIQQGASRFPLSRSGVLVRPTNGIQQRS